MTASSPIKPADRWRDRGSHFAEHNYLKSSIRGLYNVVVTVEQSPNYHLKPSAPTQMISPPGEVFTKARGRLWHGVAGLKQLLPESLP